MAKDEIGVTGEQVERLVLALAADRAGGRRRGEDRDHQRLEHHQADEDPAADGGGRVGRLAAVDDLRRRSPPR